MMKYNWLIVGLVCLFVSAYGQDELSALKQKVEQGDAYAQRDLGVYYAFWVKAWVIDIQTNKCLYNVPQGKEKAFLQDAKKQGYSPYLLHKEEGPASNSEALKWFQKAAMQGEPEAHFNLAMMYYGGIGVLEDHVEAYAWFLLSSMNGNVDATEAKYLFKVGLDSSFIAAGQQRAKELQGMIERKKRVLALGSDEMPAADISPSGLGSGLLVKGGYVVTCWHVVENAKKISISYQGKDFAASLVQKDEGNDIAILRVEGADAGASLSVADSVKLGEQVFTMGFPHPGLQGSDVKFTTGSISGLTGPQNTPVYFQISAPLQGGNSGGPLFDEYGNLVGIVAAKLDSLKMLAATGDLTQNVNYAIKSDYLVPILKTVDGIKIQPSQTKPVNLLSLVEELKKSVVMIKVY